MSNFDASICPQDTVTIIRLMCKEGTGAVLDHILSPIFYAIVCNSKGMMDQSYAPQSPAASLSAEFQKAWDRLVMEHPDFRELLVKCCLSEPPSFNRIRSLEYLKPQRYLPMAHHPVIIKSWSSAFRGESHNLLYSTLQNYLVDLEHPKAYARYVPFVQSSGTGKSRMLDELAKRVISIPINLESNKQGSLTYPPPDDDSLQKWIRYDINPNQYDLVLHYQGFIFGLMTVTLKCLKEIQESDSSITQLYSGGHYYATVERTERLAAEFRNRMTETEIVADNFGFRRPRYGKYRKDFYAEVMSLADRFQANAALKPEYSYSQADPDVVSRAKDLYHFLDPGGCCREIPLLVICFDEADSLTDPVTDYAHWTRFSEMRRALRALASCPFFSIFLSTAGKFQDLSSPNITFSANNRNQPLDLKPFPPITEVSFDEFADHVAPNGQWTLERLASIYHIAHLGRALFPTRYDSGDNEVRDDIVWFARDKLLDGKTFGELNDDMKLACLAVRLGLDFRTTKWLDREQERIQVERHMRICLAASPGFRDMITVSPSEPLLAEAASLGMLAWKQSPADALLTHIEGSYLSVGERGELVASLLVLLARDTARQFSSPVRLTPALDPRFLDSRRRDGEKRVVSVTGWLTALLNSPKDDLLAQLPAKYTNIDVKEQPLSEAFKDACIWFNHLIKVNNYANIKQENLWRLLARGAAAVVVDGQRGLDIIIPILFRNCLCKENVSAVLIQVKNDEFINSVRPSLFDIMDPFEVGLFSGPDKAPNPVIRMVFALGSEKSGIRYLQDPNCSSWRPGDANFIGYDIWCAGATHETFKVIEPLTNDYQRLLKSLRHISSPYALNKEWNGVWKRRSRARRKMHPGVGAEDEDYQQK